MQVADRPGGLVEILDEIEEARVKRNIRNEPNYIAASGSRF
jgi:hypothetical protein